MTGTIRRNVYFRIAGKITRTSDKAICMQISALQGMPIKAAPSWFPRSQIESLTMGGNGEEDYFDATEWILEQKGFASDMTKITSTPQRVVVDRFPDDPLESEPLPQSPFRAVGFDDMDSDIPF